MITQRTFKFATNQRGVSLIENMVALIVFSVAALGWLAVGVSMAKQSGETEMATQAAIIGRMVSDDLRTVAYEDLITGTQTYTISGVEMGDVVASNATADNRSEVMETQTYVVTWTVNEVTTTSPGRKDVLITVSWENLGLSDSSTSTDIRDFMELAFSRSE